MPTIQEHLQDEMNKARRLYSRRRREIRLADKVLPKAMLHTEFPAGDIYLALCSDLHLNFRAKTAEGGRKLAAVFMDILGTTDSEKRNIIEGAYTIVIEQGRVRVDIDVDTRQCKKYLVTERHVISVCGELDTDRYLEAVPVD